MSNYGPSAVAAFIVFVGVLIFVHELGHFLAAKYFGIKVLKFSLGFGPPLLAFRRGETQYQIAAIPLGGFVKMVGDVPGEEVEPEDRGRAFNTAPIHHRAVIALAGPVFNLLFPVLCFFAYYLLRPTVVAPIVGQIEIGTPAARAGLQNGDRILSLNGERAWSFQRVADIISAHAGETLELEVNRHGERMKVRVTPMAVTKDDEFGSPEKQGRIGISPASAGTRIGVDEPTKNLGGFQTGDRIISVDGVRVRRAEELEQAIRKVAGRRVELVVARPQPLAAGDLLLAEAEMPVQLQVPVPEGASGVADLGLSTNDTFLRGIVPGGPADRAGLRPGDHIVRVNGQPISLFWSFLSAMERASDAVPLVVRRDGREITVALKNDQIIRKHDVTGKDRVFYDAGIGIGPYPRGLETQHWSTSVPEETERVELTLGEASVESVRRTLGVIGLVTRGLVKLMSHEVSLDNLGGPIMLFQVAAQAAELGVFAYLHLLAVISVNIGLFNLLPIPIFDGGHLMFCAIEAVKRKPISLRAREAATIIGLVLIIALFLLAARNDILRLDVF